MSSTLPFRGGTWNWNGGGRTQFHVDRRKVNEKRSKNRKSYKNRTRSRYANSNRRFPQRENQNYTRDEAQDHSTYSQKYLRSFLGQKVLASDGHKSAMFGVPRVRPKCDLWVQFLRLFFVRISTLPKPQRWNCLKPGKFSESSHVKIEGPKRGLPVRAGVGPGKKESIVPERINDTQYGLCLVGV